MKQIHLNLVPANQKCTIKQCLSPGNSNVYRLMEMGLIAGSVLTIVRNSRVFGGLEIAINESRICIDQSLAAEFLVSFEST